MRNKKRNKILLLLILLLGISIGYALISTTLKINGTANILKQTWSVYWGVPTVSEGSVSDVVPTRTEDTGDPANTKLVWTVDLALPGDYYEFTVDAINDGTIDAMITSINNTVTPTLPEYIKYEVKYADGIEPAVNHLLAKNTTEKYKVRVYYDESLATAETINNIPVGGNSYTFTFNVTYSQATDEAILKPAMKLGDFFTLVPDEEYASTTIAGFSGSVPTGNQTLWRVININEDGTYDAVSHYASNYGITIEGTDGYKNYIAGLNDVASKYAKEGYTVGTRMLGYDGQTAVLQDTSEFDGTQPPAFYKTTTPTPTSGVGEEYSGGVFGDTLYLKDYLALVDVYDGDLSVKTKFGSTECCWVASRYYQYNADQDIFYHGRFICNIMTRNSMRYWGNAWYDRVHTYKIRPVIVLKKDVVKNGGDGTLNNPYTFE